MVPVHEIGVAVCGAATLLTLVAFSSGASSRNEIPAVKTLGALLTLVQSTTTLSLHFGFIVGRGGEEDLASAWTEHVFPHNRIIVQQGNCRGPAIPNNEGAGVDS